MKKVLVIDDDADIRLLIATMVRRGGHEVVEASDGLAGVEAFRGSRFDVVITDLLMTQQDGFKTIHEVRLLEPGIPVIAVTGFGWDETSPLVQNALKAGANRVFGKPFRADHLLQAIDEITGG